MRTALAPNDRHVSGRTTRRRLAVATVFPWTAALALALAALPAGRLSLAGDGTPAPAPQTPPVEGEIAWVKTLVEAFEAAKKQDKPVFIAINAERVDGGKAEPAGKELREHTYK